MPVWTEEELTSGTEEGQLPEKAAMLSAADRQMAEELDDVKNRCAPRWVSLSELRPKTTTLRPPRRYNLAHSPTFLHI